MYFQVRRFSYATVELSISTAWDNCSNYRLPIAWKLVVDSRKKDQYLVRTHDRIVWRKKMLDLKGKEGTDDCTRTFGVRTRLPLWTLEAGSRGHETRRDNSTDLQILYYIWTILPFKYRLAVLLPTYFNETVHKILPCIVEYGSKRASASYSSTLGEPTQICLSQRAKSLGYDSATSGSGIKSSKPAIMMCRRPFIIVAKYSISP